MTAMNILNVCNYAYPNQINLENIKFGQDGNGPIFITYWNVDGITEPTVDQLNAMIPTYQHQFDYDYFTNVGLSMLEQYIDSVAQQKNYSSAISCISYINSTNTQWRNEAITFNSWRDSVYVYVIAQQALMQSSSRSIPSFDDFKIELPEITWP